MKPREDVKREFCRQWIEKADGDLRACRQLLAAGEGVLAGAAFHAQQAAEKFLKAFLVWHQVEFPKTHDIGRLLELVQTCDESLATVLDVAAELTPYGVEYRYPGDYPEVSASDARHALDVAEAIRKEVHGRLPLDVAG